MKAILKLALVFCLFACGVTVCVAAPVQPLAGQTTETKKMGKKRRNKKVQQAQKVQQAKVKKKKGSKGLLRAVKSVICGTVGAGLGFFVGSEVAAGLAIGSLLLITSIPGLFGLGGLIFSRTGVSVMIAMPYIGMTTGLCYGAWLGWRLDDGPSEDYEAAYVSVPRID